MHDVLPLARSTVDPDAVSRPVEGLVSRLVADAATQVVLVQRGLVATRGSALDLRTPSEVPGNVWSADNVVYLGRDDDGSYLGLTLPEHLGEERR